MIFLSWYKHINKKVVGFNFDLSYFYGPKPALLVK